MPRFAGAAPAEHGEREVRRDRPDAPLDEPHVLLLGVRDAAERAAEVDPDPLALRATGSAGHEARVLQREPPRDQAELAEPVELARGLRVHVVERLEVVDLGRDLGAERRGVEPVDAADR